MVEKKLFENKFVIVCGGSKGIGKATSKEIVKLGGNLCIVARNLENLQNTASELKELILDENQFIEIISCDTTNKEKLEPLLKQLIDRKGIPDYLINCVGYAYPEYIENLTLNDFKKNMEINYYGQLTPILILLPYFMERKRGYIANISSMMGYFGMMGYATYAPTKFAIVGLTEALRHELKPFNIKFSILYPPDTDTPGFNEENKTKPEELKIMSERGGLLKPKEVAHEFVKGILKEKFEILPGEAKFIWRMYRHFPKLVRYITDKDYKNARIKSKK
ncbi:MAG: SDR family oxidoreductase [Candidatus Lokiarchaeota archaeon]